MFFKDAVVYRKNTKKILLKERGELATSIPERGIIEIRRLTLQRRLLERPMSELKGRKVPTILIYQKGLLE